MFRLPSADLQRVQFQTSFKISVRCSEWVSPWKQFQSEDLIMFSFKYKNVCSNKSCCGVVILATAQWFKFLSSCAHSFGLGNPALGVQDLNPPWRDGFICSLLCCWPLEKQNSLWSFLQSVANSAPDTEKTTKQGTGSEFWGFNVVNSYLWAAALCPSWQKVRF